jgi:hypothetical protein
MEKPIPHNAAFLVDVIVPMVLSGRKKPESLPSLAGSVAERLLQCKASAAEKPSDIKRQKYD